MSEGILSSESESLSVSWYNMAQNNTKCDCDRIKDEEMAEFIGGVIKILCYHLMKFKEIPRISRNNRANSMESPCNSSEMQNNIRNILCNPGIQQITNIGQRVSAEEQI